VTQRPNVLFILCDQLRYDAVGYAGLRDIRTPVMDKLAEEGHFFKNAFTPLPVCAPARQSILTGVQPDSIGALFNYNFIRTNGANPASPTWVSGLRNAGYRCGISGSWEASPFGNADAFGYEILFDQGAYANEITERYGSIENPGGWFGNDTPIRWEDTQAYRICQKAIDFIRDCGNTPWHVWVNITDPHLPCRPSEPFSAMYKAEDMQPWPGFGDTLENKPYIQKQQIHNWHLENFSWTDFAPTVARYHAMVTQIDASIGRIIDSLRDNDQLNNTLVILTSDHGDTCGDHGMMDKHYILYDCVTHVPFIVRYPVLGQGDVDNFMSSGLDIAPTIEDICGLVPCDVRHGHSIRAYLDGSETPDYAVFTSNGQQFGLFTQRGIRTAQYKYIWNLTDVDELYDITADPGEKQNLAHLPEFAEVIKELGGKLYAELKRRGDPFANSWVSWQLGQ